MVVRHIRLVGLLAISIAPACGGGEDGDRADDASRLDAGRDSMPLDAFGTDAHAALQPDLDPRAGNDAFRAPSCGTPLRALTGAMCGTPERPCVVQSERAIAVAPGTSVSIAIADDGAHLYARSAPPQYADASLALEPIPGPTARGRSDIQIIGSLEVDASGRVLALLYGGAPNQTELWQRTESGWSFVSKPGTADAYESDALTASASCLHAAMSLHVSVDAAHTNPVYSVFDGERWQQFILGPSNIKSYSRPALALGPTGRPHLVYWKQLPDPANAWTLYWAIPGETLEAVATSNDQEQDYVNGAPVIAVGGDASAERALVLHTIVDVVRTNRRLVLSSRTSPDGWSQRDVLAFRTLEPAEACPPEADAPACTFTSEDVRPIAMFASGDDVRFFAERTRTRRTVAYRCTNIPVDCVMPGACGPVTQCEFADEVEPTLEHEVLVGRETPEGTSFEAFDGPAPSAVAPDGRFFAIRQEGTTVSLVEYGNGS